MNPFKEAWLVIKEGPDYNSEPPAYLAGSPPPLPQVLDSRAAGTTFDQDRAVSPETWERWSGERPDDLSQWNTDDLDLAQSRAPTAEWHQRLSDERARRGVNMIPRSSMVDVGRDPAQNPMPRNRTEGDFFDSQRGDFNANIRDFQQKNAGEPMRLAWRLLKMTPEEMEAAGFPDAAQQMREMQQQQQQVSQQGQATAPKMTPQALSYQQQIDAKQEKADEAQRIRAMLKEGRQVGSARDLIQEFYEKHGHYPNRIPKKMMRPRPTRENLRGRDE